MDPESTTTIGDSQFDTTIKPKSLKKQYVHKNNILSYFEFWKIQSLFILIFN